TARRISPELSATAAASAWTSSRAKRVPEPIEKCAVRKASPTSTYLPADQRALWIIGKRRQCDLLITSEAPCSSSANTSSQYRFESSSLMSAKPIRSNVGASTSTRKVLIDGEY